MTYYKDFTRVNKARFEAIILDALHDDYFISRGYIPPTDERRKIALAMKIFESEKLNNFQKWYDYYSRNNPFSHPYTNAVLDWLQGLALDIPFYNYDILELLKGFKLVPEDESDQIDLYWHSLAYFLAPEPIQIAHLRY